MSTKVAKRTLLITGSIVFLIILSIVILSVQRTKLQATLPSTSVLTEGIEEEQSTKANYYEMLQSEENIKKAEDRVGNNCHSSRACGVIAEVECKEGNKNMLYYVGLEKMNVISSCVNITGSPIKCIPEDWGCTFG